jgi:HdeA/HdeB family
MSRASMVKTTSSGCMAAFLITGLCWPGTAAAQTATDRAVELFTCKDVMREPNTSREVAIAFLHGYLLGKSGGSRFNVEMLERQTGAFIEQCLDNPKDNAADVMAKLKK